jgi:carboxymethylenebutenolidase
MCVSATAAIPRSRSAHVADHLLIRHAAFRACLRHAKLTSRQPTAPINLTGGIRCPVLGLFGSDDGNPSPADVNRLEAELQRQGKDYQFHRYDGAGHAFNAWYRPNYRQEQAQDGWDKIFAFYGKHLNA